MAIGDAYATAAEYRAAVDRTDAADDAIIGRDLTALSRYLDWKLNQRAGFQKDAAVTVRVYEGDGTRRLLLRFSIASATGLIVTRDTDADGDFADETALTSNTDFELRPLDADKYPEARPWTELYIPSWAPTYGTWYEGERVQVTAIHGWPAVPAAIKSGTIWLTSIVRIESPYATQQIQELDQLVQASPQARSILNGLMQSYNHYPVVVA